MSEQTSPEDRQIRVALVAPHLDLLAYACLLEQHAFRATHQSETTEGLSDEITATGTDALLADAELVDASALSQLESLAQQGALRRVALLQHGGEQPEARADGAIRWFDKSQDDEQLFRFLRGDPWARHISKKAQECVQSPPHFTKRQKPQNSHRITNRERQVWALVALGHTVREAADQLQLSESTVDSHKSRLMKKLEARKTADLVLLAVRYGLVEI